MRGGDGVGFEMVLPKELSLTSRPLKITTLLHPIAITYTKGTLGNVFKQVFDLLSHKTFDAISGGTGFKCKISTSWRLPRYEAPGDEILTGWALSMVAYILRSQCGSVQVAVPSSHSPVFPWQVSLFEAHYFFRTS